MEDQPNYVGIANQNIFVRRAILALIAVLIGFLIYWLSGFSRVEFVVSSGQGSNFRYSLVNQGANKLNEFDSSKSNFFRTMRRGSYEISITDGEKTFFTVVDLKGFFRKTRVIVEPQKERSRTFIGENPALCMHDFSGSLVSYDCTGGLDKVNYHVPATSRQPSYVQTNVKGFTKTMEGIIDLKGETYIMAKEVDVIGSGPAHSLYKVNGPKQVLNPPYRNRHPLEGLEPQATYYIKNFSDGFVIYDNHFSSVKYYPSVGSQPQDVTLAGPNNKDLSPNPSPLDVSNDRLLSVYTNSYSFGDRARPKEIQSEIVYGKKGQESHLTINAPISSARLCGTNKVCIVSDNTLSVYDSTSQKPKALFKVNNVNSIENTDRGLLLVNNRAVINLDVDKRTGHVDYTFGAYKFNRLVISKNGYILSLTNNKNIGVALKIDLNDENRDNIDKKISAFQTDPTLTAHVYGKVIYIRPYIATLKFDSSTQNFGIDPIAKKAAVKKVNKALAENGIDTSLYQIYAPGIDLKEQ